MELEPTGHHVLIELEPINRKFEQSIIERPDKNIQREQAGAQFSQVLAVGPEAWNDKPAPWAKVGDRVVTIRYPGAQFDYDGEDKRKRIINDDEIIAVIKGDGLQRVEGKNECKPLSGCCL